MNKQIENIIIRFLNNRAGIEERETLSRWLEEPENEQIFQSFVRTNFLIDSNLLEVDNEETRKRLLAKIHQDKRRSLRKRRMLILKYAAIFIALLGIGYFYQNSFTETQETIVPSTEFVTLEREDGSIQILNPQDSREVRNSKGAVIGKQDKDILSYSADHEEEALVYNTLKVPYGKKFRLELSDGSLVHLNSGSSITYPVKFLNQVERSVSIVGEAFFEVHSNSENPFLVQTEALNVRVTGTHFNVAAYPEDPTTDVVLVEGQVAIYPAAMSELEVTNLSPGYKGSFNQRRRVVEVEKVNTRIYTAWREGELVFRNMSFNNILKKLERHFHVEIINQNPELGNQMFNASFDNEELETILEYFDESYEIDYEIKNNTVIFK